VFVEVEGARVLGLAARGVYADIAEGARRGERVEVLERGEVGPDLADQCGVSE